MSRTKPQRTEIATYPYAAVETALAGIFGADPNTQRRAFRARLKHFQRLGLPGIESGKGTRVAYTYDLAAQWLIGLLMSEIGVDPVVTVRVVKERWEFLDLWIRRATDSGATENPVYLSLRPRLMSGSWAGGKSDPKTLEWISCYRRYDFHLKGRDGRPIQRENIETALDRGGDWLCVRNLSESLIGLQAALRDHANADVTT